MRYIIPYFLLLFSLAYGETKKFVVDLTTGDLETFESRFLNGVPGTIKFFESLGDTVDVAVVIHGDAYKFFVANLEHTKYWQDEQLAKVQERLLAAMKQILKTHPVTIEMCKVGMQKREILSPDLYPFVVPIASAMTGLVRWQNAGYAYVPIH